MLQRGIPLVLLLFHTVTGCSSHFFHLSTCIKRNDEYLTSKSECKDVMARFCEQMEKHCQSPQRTEMMRAMCPKTCNYCESEVCTDAVPQLCIAHQQMGECQRPTLYTRNFCKKTCNLCYDQMDASGKPVCQDTMKDCQNIARMNLCGRLGNVKERCRLSCHLCT